MIEVSATNKLDNGKVLVVTKNSRQPFNTQEYYAVKEDKVDQFIKERKGLALNNGFQKTLTYATSIISGILAGCYVKSNLLIKSAVGTAAGLGILSGLKAVDSAINDKSMKNMLKRNDAEDITKEMIEKYQQH